MTLTKGQWVKTSATEGKVNFGAAAAEVFTSFDDDYWGDVELKAGIARTDVTTGTQITSGDWIREGTGSSTQYYERMDTNKLTTSAAHGLTNGQQRVVVSTITTGEDFTDGTRWQAADADADSDLDYSTVTGQTRLDVGDVVTNGSDKYQLISADTGVTGLAVGDVVYVIEGASGTELYLSADRVAAGWSPDASDRIDLSLSGEQALSRVALAENTYTTDSASSTAVSSVDTAAEAFTLVADHGIETGDVIYLGGIGASDIEFYTPGDGWGELTSTNAFFAVVDGNTLKLALNAQEANSDPATVVQIRGTDGALTDVAIFGTEALVAIHEDSSLNASYDKDYLFKLTDDQRQKRIDDRVTSIAHFANSAELGAGSLLIAAC